MGDARWSEFMRNVDFVLSLDKRLGLMNHGGRSKGWASNPPSFPTWFERFFVLFFSFLHSIKKLFNNFIPCNYLFFSGRLCSFLHIVFLPQAICQHNLSLSIFSPLFLLLFLIALHGTLLNLSHKEPLSSSQFPPNTTPSQIHSMQLSWFFFLALLLVALISVHSFVS